MSTTPTDTPHIPLVVFAAGSLIIPFNHLEQAFEARYPNIDVLGEYHGSIQVIRHVSEIHEIIDVVATADASLIPMLMFETTDPDTGLAYADWYIKFASNHLAIAYTNQSQRINEINDQNWPDVLASEGVKVGFSDPRFDPSGYRTLMAFALMQQLYGNYHWFDNMFKDQFTYPITIFLDDDQAFINVPEVLETRPGSHIVLRGSSIQLVALLQSGDLDYAFEYESVIKQHDLNLFKLLGEVNLGSDIYEEFYSKVLVTMDFQRFSTVQPEFRGERIGYGITIPSNAAHPKEAAQFIDFLLSSEGRAIMEADYHAMFDEPLCYQFDNVPAELRSYCSLIETP